jgi:VEFS-Box of polycomb protein
MAGVLAQQKDGDNAKLASLLMGILVEHEIPMKSPILSEEKERYNMSTNEIKLVKEETTPESDDEEQPGLSNLQIANYLIEGSDIPADQKKVMTMWNSFVCSGEATSIPHNEKRVAAMVKHFIKLNKKCILSGGLKFSTLLFLVNKVLYKCLTVENLYSIWTEEFEKNNNGV